MPNLAIGGAARCGAQLHPGASTATAGGDHALVHRDSSPPSGARSFGAW
jgi:hypothetical protein